MRKRRKKTAASRLLEFLLNNLAGNIIGFLLIFFCLLGLNLIFSRNDYEVFSLLTGLEVIVIVPLAIFSHYWRKR